MEELSEVLVQCSTPLLKNHMVYIVICECIDLVRWYSIVVVLGVVVVMSACW